ncbi:hypothetical protein R6Q59_020016 [Mikania micrantha]
MGPCGGFMGQWSSRLVFGSAVYFIWQRRSLRQFDSKNRSVEDVAALILDTVRLRLLGLPYNNSSELNQVWTVWGMNGMDLVDLSGWGHPM